MITQLKKKIFLNEDKEEESSSVILNTDSIRKTFYYIGTMMTTISWHGGEIPASSPGKPVQAGPDLDLDLGKEDPPVGCLIVPKKNNQFVQELIEARSSQNLVGALASPKTPRK